MSHYPLPHEIKGVYGEIIYKCRVCHASEKLHWYGGTSCPVCDRPECIAALNEEFQEAMRTMNPVDHDGYQSYGE